MNSTRSINIKAGVRIEIFTILWMIVEMSGSIVAGILAKSVLLTAFGLDSLIELVSGSILLWRLSTENRGEDLINVERAEKRAAWVVAASLILLSAFVLVSSVYLLITHTGPESSIFGIGISAAALLIMPWLAVSKRRISRQIDSAALAGDAANSITCAVMAGTVLAGLLFNALLGLWWVEYVAALIFLVWLVRETKEVLAEARDENMGK